MSQVIWQEKARNAMSGFVKNDPGGANQVLDSVNLLIRDPRPPGAHRYGPDEYRIRIGFYRVMYVIKQNQPVIIAVEHVGRSGTP